MPNGKYNQNLNRRTILRGMFFSLAVVSSLPLLSATPARADQLDDLRASGAVGEGFDGFARARDGSASAFVKNLNDQRRAIYVKRAKSEGVSVDQVGRVYAEQIIRKAPKGTWLLGENGQWTQK